MRVLIQRVKKASVTVNQKCISKIDQGLLIFLGVHLDDTKEQADWLVNKCLNLRIFEDDNSKMNLSLLDLNAQVIVVSQFTLYGTCLKGKRPEFTKAAKGKQAEELYNYFVDKMKSLHPHIQTGSFGADMKVELLNDGPVTLMIEK